MGGAIGANGLVIRSCSVAAIASVPVSKNLVRLAIVVWIAIALHAGFTTWSDHEVPTVRRVPVTDANLSGLETVKAEYECPAPIGGSGSPELVDDLTNVVGPAEEPCHPYLRGRQVLFWVDILVGLGVLALTFAHLPRQRRDRREAVHTVAA
jgi:hypothetical protein